MRVKLQVVKLLSQSSSDRLKVRYSFWLNLSSVAKPLRWISVESNASSTKTIRSATNERMLTFGRPDRPNSKTITHPPSTKLTDGTRSKNDLHQPRIPQPSRVPPCSHPSSRFRRPCPSPRPNPSFPCPNPATPRPNPKATPRPDPKTSSSRPNADQRTTRQRPNSHSPSRCPNTKAIIRNCNPKATCRRR